MASRDYYNNRPWQGGASSTRPAPPAYYNPYDTPSETSSFKVPPPYASPYSSQQHLVPDQHGQSVSPLSESPFDTPFDDRVYHAGPHQPGFGRTPPDDMLSPAGENISLQNRPSKDGDANDHVYEAPQPQRPRRGGSRRVGFGQLGMFGTDKNRIPFVVYFFSLVQLAVFIGEIVRNAQLTGSPIMIHPQINPMIGPSTYVLINMGARFVACMHNVQGIQSSTVPISWPCPNTTTSDPNSPSQHCTLSELCGFSGVPNPLYDGNLDQSPQPNQWFRFIVPMFLHAGIIHIGFNLLLQLTMAREMEKSIGSIRFFLVYVSAGIFGFVMGGNFAAPFISSTGASGSLFGIIALTLLDLLYSWRDRRNPVRELMFIVLDVVISFVLGLLPGLDNFSHIGGFLTGLALGICLLHSPNALRRRIGDDASYASVNPSYTQSKAPAFLKNPIAFFHGRKPLWWAWWLFRAGSLVAVVAGFIALLNNFYIYHNTCGWCKYLSCLPINNWCDLGNLQLTNTTSKRDLLEGFSLATNLML